jgi:AraC family transcriptional regulator
MPYVSRRALQDDTILQGRNNAYHHFNPTPGLSLKTMRNGQALYEIDGGRFAVNDDVYLILNEQQPYTINIESNSIVSSFCVFFPQGWVEDAFHTLTTSTDQLLSEPALDNLRSVGFFEKLRPHDEIVSPVLGQIRHALKEDVVSLGWLEDKLRLLLSRMLHVQAESYREAEQLPGVRRATRLELYRRLYRTRDYIHANLGQPLSLDELARVAYQSPYHFLRTFKQVFGQTPHEYLTQKRMERAQFLLLNTQQPITDICLEVGFESLGSFSSLFQRRAGVSPRRYRQEAAQQRSQF